jgi:hypothetical protein
MTQTSIESGSWAEFNPVSAITDTMPIEFDISGAGTSYIDLAQTQLLIRVQLLKGDGTAIDNTSHVAPCNLFLHSLFSEVDVKLNGTLISSSNNTYPYRAYIETLLSYGYDAKRSQLTSALYYKDQGGDAGFEEGDPHAGGAANNGMKKRNSFFEEGGIVPLQGPIHLDLMFQDRYLPSDVGLQLRFVRSKDAFSLMSDAQNAAFRVKIHECKLLIRKAYISPSVFVAQAQAFEVGNAKYPIRRVVCKSYSVGTGMRDNVHEGLFTGQIPSRIVIGMVNNAAFNGSYRHNPFNFKHFDLSSIKIYVDGQANNNIKAIECDFETHNSLAGYLSLFAGSGKYRRDEGLDIDRQEYERGYTLFAYDLSPDLSEEGYFNLAKEGSIRVELKFARGLPNTINVIAYAEFESIIEINREKQVLIDYAN